MFLLTANIETSAIQVHQISHTPNKGARSLETQLKLEKVSSFPVILGSSKIVDPGS